MTSRMIGKGGEAMHDWSDNSVDWRGISDAAEYIGSTLRKWGRVSITDTKEKFGTVRVYCSLGWWSLHDITHPGYHFIQWRRVGHIPVPAFINRLVLPYHRFLYRLVYSRAVRRWPHLSCEILHSADHPDLLREVPGFRCKHRRQEEQE